MKAGVCRPEVCAVAGGDATSAMRIRQNARCRLTHEYGTALCAGSGGASSARRPSCSSDQRALERARRRLASRRAPRASRGAARRAARGIGASAPARSREARRSRVAGGVEILLKPLQRDEHGAHVALPGRSEKSPSCAGSTIAADGEAERAAEIVLTPVQRLDGHGRGVLHTDDHGPRPPAALRRRRRRCLSPARD